MGAMTGAADERDPNLARALRDMVAVTHASEGQIAIWHVDVGTESGLARMAGAWVLPVGPAEENPADDRATALLRGRRILATPAGRAAVEALMADAEVEGFVDIDATLASMGEVIGDLQGAFETELAGRKGKLVDPSWPELPPAPDFAALQDSARDQPGAADGGEQVAVALEMARWLEGLVKTWDKVEAQRVARKFLAAHGGKNRRSLPTRI